MPEKEHDCNQKTSVTKRDSPDAKGRVRVTITYQCSICGANTGSQIYWE
jgi:hypothetical protein